MAGPEVTGDERARIVELYDLHGNISKVARLTRRARRTVHERLADAGRVKPERPRVLSDAAIEQMATTYGQGAAIAAIARQYAVSTALARRALLFAGVSLRPAGNGADGPMRLNQSAPVLGPLRTVSLDYAGVLDQRTGPRDAHATYPLDADVPRTLHGLRELGLVALVASDVLPGQDRTAALAGVRDLLAAVLQSQQLGYQKADRRFFAAVIETAGCAADQVLHVDNSIRGLAPALWAGMDAVLVAADGRRPRGLPPRTPVIRHVRDLPDLLVTTGRVDVTDGACGEGIG